MRILITGGAGFIGSNLAEYFVEKGYEVVILDNLYNGVVKNLAKVHENIEFIRGDIRYAETVSSACKGVDAIIHLAAISVIQAGFLNPRETFDINLYGTLNVLEAALKQKVGKVVFASSASVYGADSENARTESERPTPLTPYAITKIGMEYLLKVFAKEHSLDTCSLRIFNPYGLYQDPQLSGAAIPNFLSCALKNEPLIIQGDGSQTRDFVHVKDVARAFELAIKTRTNGDVFNIASGRCISILDLARKIKKITNSRSEIVTSSGRRGDIGKSLADISRAKEVLGYEPSISLDDGLKSIVGYYASV